MKKFIVIFFLIFSLNSFAYWGDRWGRGWYNDWPVWTPMYWAEEIFDDYDYYPYRGYGYGPYGSPYNYYGGYPYYDYGYSPYNYYGGGYPYVDPYLTPHHLAPHMLPNFYP